MISLKKSNVKPKIAISFNPAVGGFAAHSIKKIMTDIGAVVVDADYRSFNSCTENFDQIYTNDNYMRKLFSCTKEKAEEFLKDIDGLIIPGNHLMVDPRLYGQALYNEKINTARAIAELALIHVAIQKGTPILGICGGLQILNVYLGGTLKSLDIKSFRDENYLNYNHIFLDPHSELAQTMRISISDHSLIKKVFESHSQVINDLGGKKRINDNENYLKVVAKDSKKNNIEALESQYGSPVIGVQFHPEVAINGYANATRFIYQAVSDIVIIQNKKLFESFKISAESYHNKRLLTDQIKTVKACPARAKRVCGVLVNAENLNIEETVISTNQIKKNPLAKKIFKYTVANALRFFVSKTETYITSKQIRKKEVMCNQIGVAKSRLAPHARSAPATECGARFAGFKHIMPSELFKELETSASLRKK